MLSRHAYGSAKACMSWIVILCYTQVSLILKLLALIFKVNNVFRERYKDRDSEKQSYLEVNIQLSYLVAVQFSQMNEPCFLHSKNGIIITIGIL